MLAAILGGCSTGYNLTALSKQAQDEYLAGNYETSLSHWQGLINKLQSNEKVVEGNYYAGAGKAAMKLEKTDLALQYFQEAQWVNYADAQMYEMMSYGYLLIDNLSKEIDALVYFVEHFPDHTHIMDVKSNLFEAYVKSENWDPALALWPDIESRASSSMALLEQYFTVNDQLGNTEICDGLAVLFLSKNNENITGMEWLANKNFWQAENRYQKYLKAYEQKRNNKNYASLLQAIEKSNAEFHTALAYYLTLYEITKKPKYARSIGNIYLRFDDKKKADYYYQLAGS